MCQEEETPWVQFDDDLFEGRKQKRRLTMQKSEMGQQLCMESAAGRPRWSNQALTGPGGGETPKSARGQ